MQDNRSLERFLLKLKKVQVLCIDELGYVQLSPSTTQLLFQVIADRYESGSILLTSNLEFTEWTRIFQDERMTAAILDRLVHKSKIIVFKGPSYRLNDSMERKHKTIHRKESSERKMV
jgi:DNA replication protein DnaC